MYGNPDLGNKMQLYSKTNYFLAIYPDGTVKGTQDRDDPYSIYSKFAKHFKMTVHDELF